MRTAILYVLSLFLMLSVNPVQSQDDTPDGEMPGIAGFWEVVTSAGRFVVRLDMISSVSEHEYLIDGAVRVFECTVDTTGGQTARFYYLEPVTESSSVTTGSATLNRIKDLTNKATEKVGIGNVDTVVTKNYPTTTHAKTTEFRMQNKATISQIYEHAHRVWAEEKGRGEKNTLRIKNG